MSKSVPPILSNAQTRGTAEMVGEPFGRGSITRLQLNCHVVARLDLNGGDERWRRCPLLEEMVGIFIMMALKPSI